MKFIIGKKIEMTQLWKGDTVIAVTKVQAEPNVVVQMKDGGKDGYRAVQIGYGKKKEKNVNKPQIGHTKGLGSFLKLKEFRLDYGALKDDSLKLNRGDVITVATFVEGDDVKVTGVSKGRGFQGGVKRHGFHGHGETHGTKDQVRTSGSIGPKGPARVFKGTRMTGHMGVDQVTIPSAEIVKIDEENNILYIKGGLPGARNSVVYIYGAGELKIKQTEAPKVEEAKEEEKTEEAPVVVEAVENAAETPAETAPEAGN